MKLVLSLLSLFALSAPPAAQRIQRDVFVFILDDVARFDFDRVPTPNIDALAARGAFLEEFHSMPWCMPTRRTLMSAEVHTDATGSYCKPPNATALSFEDFSLPGMMRDLDYATGIFGKWHLGPDADGMLQLATVNAYYDQWSAGVADNIKGACVPFGYGISYYDWQRFEDDTFSRSFDYQPVAMRDAAIDWLMANVHRPRFMVFSSQLAHAPFENPPAYLLNGWQIPSPTSPRDSYEAMIVALDTIVGDLMVHIPSDALVVLFADNGTPKDAEHPTQDPDNVKHSTHHHGTHVPALVVGPGIPAGVVVHQVAGVADLLPTIAEFVGFGFEREVFGQSLWPAFRGQPLARQWLTVGTDRQDDYSVNARIGDTFWKLRYDKDEFLLYNMTADPEELAPIDPARPDVAPVSEYLMPRLRAYIPVR